MTRLIQRGLHSISIVMVTRLKIPPDRIDTKMALLETMTSRGVFNEGLSLESANVLPPPEVNRDGSKDVHLYGWPSRFHYEMRL